MNKAKLIYFATLLGTAAGGIGGYARTQSWEENRGNEAFEANQAYTRCEDAIKNGTGCSVPELYNLKSIRTEKDKRKHDFNWYALGGTLCGVVFGVSLMGGMLFVFPPDEGGGIFDAPTSGKQPRRIDMAIK